MTQKMHPAYQIWKIIIPMSSNNVDSHRQLETWEYPTTHLLVTHLFVLIKMRDLLVGLLLLSVKKIHMVIIWTFFFPSIVHIILRIDLGKSLGRQTGFDCFLYFQVIPSNIKNYFTPKHLSVDLWHKNNHRLAESPLHIRKPETLVSD